MQFEKVLRILFRYLISLKPESVSSFINIMIDIKEINTRLVSYSYCF